MPLTSPTGVFAYAISAPNVDTTPRVARDLVVSLLRTARLTQLADVAALLTSELVTNVYLHGGDTVDVQVNVTIWGRRLRVGVQDDVFAVPLPRPRSGQPERQGHGRGLYLVTQLADRWGVHPPEYSPHAKEVWFELAV